MTHHLGHLQRIIEHVVSLLSLILIFAVVDHRLDPRHVAMRQSLMPHGLPSSCLAWFLSVAPRDTIHTLLLPLLDNTTWLVRLPEVSHACRALVDDDELTRQSCQSRFRMSDYHFHLFARHPWPQLVAT